MSINAYPLQWPLGWERTPSYRLNNSRFKRPSMDSACQEVLDQLRMMGVGRDDVVISTNVPTRLDGFPRSNMTAPNDKGVAVYFTRKKKNHVFAADSFYRVEDNLWAIAKSLEALRAIERYGVAQVMDRAFSGFAALPEKSVTRTCWDVLGIGHNATDDTLRAKYKQLASLLHPDQNGGAHEGWHELNEAWAQIKQIRNIA
jgi:hypothetical protein